MISEVTGRKWSALPFTCSLFKMVTFSQIFITDQIRANILSTIRY